jgi:hypothetical protein
MPDPDPPPDRNDVWAEVRGNRVHGTYSVSGGWVEVVADNGQYKTAQVGESSVEEVAERLLSELYRRGSGAVDD